MQEGEKSSVETTKTSARTHRARVHRSVPAWQCLLIMLTILLQWHNCAPPQSTMRNDLHGWQGGAQSIKRRKVKTGKKNSDTDKVRDYMPGREYACSLGPKTNRLRKQLIESTPNVVHNMQNGWHHDYREGGRRKRTATDPNKVSAHIFCLKDNYWKGGKCVWELITLKNMQTHIHSSLRGEFEEETSTAGKSDESWPNKNKKAEMQKIQETDLQRAEIQKRNMATQLPHKVASAVEQKPAGKTAGSTAPPDIIPDEQTEEAPAETAISPATVDPANRSSNEDAAKHAGPYVEANATPSDTDSQYDEGDSDNKTCLEISSEEQVNSAGESSDDSDHLAARSTQREDAKRKNENQ